MSSSIAAAEREPVFVTCCCGRFCVCIQYDCCWYEAARRVVLHNACMLVWKFVFSIVEVGVMPTMRLWPLLLSTSAVVCIAVDQVLSSTGLLTYLRTDLQHMLVHTLVMHVHTCQVCVCPKLKRGRVSCNVYACRSVFAHGAAGSGNVAAEGRSLSRS